MAKKKKDIPMPMQLGSVKKQPAGIKIVCRILKYLFLALIVAISIGPIIWAGLSSFKTYAEINTSAIALPKSFNFKNYADAFKYAPIQKYFLNSIIIVLVSVAVTVCFVLHSNFFTEEELKRNYDFYQTVTLHHSSLSTCIFGILASQIGYDEEAYKYFSQSARMDLDDMHDNFYAGIHAANMAGTWQGIVFGFAGVRSNTGELTIHPKLPEQWKSYEFCVEYHGSDMRIKIEQGKVTYKLLNQVPITFKSNHEPITLNKEGEEYVQEI